MLGLYTIKSYAFIFHLILRQLVPVDHSVLGTGGVLELLEEVPPSPGVIKRKFLH